jgi:hypothetical protein
MGRLTFLARLAGRSDTYETNEITWTGYNDDSESGTGREVEESVFGGIG